jgi:hypothetical protein
MCVALGLSVRGQIQRIQRTRSLGSALRRIPIETRGGVQRINCLRLDKVALWLAGVQTNHIKPEIRAKIEVYPDELAPIATEVFFRIIGAKATQLIPKTTEQQVTQIAEQIDMLEGVVTLLREHLSALLSLPNQVDGITARLGDVISMLESLADHQETTDHRLAQSTCAHNV